MSEPPSGCIRFKIAPDGLSVCGPEYSICGVRVVIGEEFDEPERIVFAARLQETMPDVHPMLLAPLRELAVVAQCMPGAPPAAAASAITETGQVCIWWNGALFGLPNMVPQLKLKTIEHECAHLLHPTRGAPNLEEWERAVDRDAERSPGSPRLIDPAQEEHPAFQMTEDWAYYVQYFRQEQRGEAAGYRTGFPHRAKIVERVLGHGTKLP